MVSCEVVNVRASSQFTILNSQLFQLRVPVREVEEVPPRRMELARTEVADGMPARLLRLRDQLHRGLLRAAVALLDVAGEAGANHVLPVRAPPRDSGITWSSDSSEEE